jgi:hypothetical protein
LKGDKIMALILDRCYFCLQGKAEFTIALDEEDDAKYHLCKGCKKQYDEVAENRKKSPLDLPRRNPSDVCKSCGLCCVALCAKVEKKEAETLLEQANETGRYPRDVTLEQFCTYRDNPPIHNKEWILNFPCVYLKGSLLDYTSCGVYDLERPQVCQSYLCKIAVKYKLGVLSQSESSFLLRQAFINGDVSIFNWNSAEADQDEERVSTLHMVANFIDALNKNGVAEHLREWAVCQYLTPSYHPTSNTSINMLDMYLYTVDREDFRLDLFVEPAVIATWDTSQKKAAMHTMIAVLLDIRGLFERVKLKEKMDPLPPAAESTEPKTD